MRVGQLAALSVVLGLACTPGAPPPPVTPADVTALEARAAAHPEDPAVQLALAEAYYAVERFADARRILTVVLGARPEDREAQTYLGFVYEGLAQYDSARAVYAALLAARPDRAVQRLLAGRLALLTRKELVWAARQAIARESLLAQTPPAPNTIAVLPFHYVGTDTTFQPLERGLAAVIVTDLSRVQRLKLIERARVQVLLDELQLGESGRVDPGTGARSGRLVGAAEVVQGEFATDPGARLRMDATVVRAADAQVAAAGSNADDLRALFDIEKAVVFQLLDRLGITLAPAERVAISERPTRDLEAFLLYSRGLEAEDRGDFAAAARAFQQAVQRDPGFQAAAQQAAVSQGVEVASAMPATDLAGAVVGRGGNTAAPAPPSPPLLTAINGAVPTGAGALQAVGTTATISVPPTNPNRICEGASCDGPARAALIGTVIIILPRP